MTVHLGRTHGRDRRDLANSGVHRIKAQVLGVQSREARGREARRSEGRVAEIGSRNSSIWVFKGQVARDREISGELGSSQVESPNIGYSKSRGREVAREGQPSDLDHRRTVGSARGITRGERSSSH
jgi:hypothetical protein